MPPAPVLSASHKKHRQEICAAYDSYACDTSAVFSPSANRFEHDVRMGVTCILALAMSATSWLTPWRSPLKYVSAALAAYGGFQAWQSSHLSTMAPDEHRIVRLPFGVTLDLWADNFKRNYFWERHLYECKTTPELSSMHIKVILKDT